MAVLREFTLAEDELGAVPGQLLSPRGRRTSCPVGVGSRPEVDARPGAWRLPVAAEVHPACQHAVRSGAVLSAADWLTTATSLRPL